MFEYTIKITIEIKVFDHTIIMSHIKRLQIQKQPNNKEISKDRQNTRFGNLV